MYYRVCQGDHQGVFFIGLNFANLVELSRLFWFKIKGQLISKGLFGVFNSPKKRMKTSQPELS